VHTCSCAFFLKVCTSSCIGLARTICLYTAHKQYFWQGNHQIYDHNSCIYKVLANPRCVCVVVLDLTFMTSDAASTTQLDVRAQLHAHTSTNKNASRPSLQRPQATHTHIHTRTHLTGMCPRFTPVTSTSTEPHTHIHTHAHPDRYVSTLHARHLNVHKAALDVWTQQQLLPHGHAALEHSA